MRACLRRPHDEGFQRAAAAAEVEQTEELASRDVEQASREQR